MIGIGVLPAQQAWSFFVVFCFGLLAGLVCLGYLKKAKMIERVLIDFLTTIFVVAIFILAVELTTYGQIRWYVVVSYVLSTTISFLLSKKLIYSKKAKDLISAIKEKVCHKGKSTR